MKDKLERLLDIAHSKGIKIPCLRDPVRGTPSVSLTMLFISFNLYVFTMVNKFAGWFSIDSDGVGQLLIICSGLYFGRSVASKPGTIKEEKEK